MELSSRETTVCGGRQGMVHAEQVWGLTSLLVQGEPDAERLGIDACANDELA